MTEQSRLPAVYADDDKAQSIFICMAKINGIKAYLFYTVFEGYFVIANSLKNVHKTWT